MPMLKGFRWLRKTTPRIESYLEDAVLSGRKICFIRPVPYLEVGDTFEQFGAKFRITKLEEGNLEEICQRIWAEAGYDSYEGLRESWFVLHKQFNPKHRVWLHYFERIE